MDLPYIYRWDRQGRKDQRCRMLARGTMNSCLLEFEDGYQMVTSRNAIRNPEVTDWIAFDDVKFTDADNLIWVNPDAGLHLEHLNVALNRWGCSQFLVL